MDLSQIDSQALSILAGIACHVNVRFGKNAMSASFRRQKQICGWFRDHYQEPLKKLPKEIADQISPEVNDREVLSFLADCLRQAEWNAEERRQTIRQTAAELPEDVQYELVKLSSTAAYSINVPSNGRAEILIQEERAFCRKLCFESSDSIPVEMSPDHLFCEFYLTKQESEYWFHVKPFSSGADDSSDCFISFPFQKVWVETECYRADRLSFSGNTAWEYLAVIAYSVCEKRFTPGGLNERERELLPLLLEIIQLESSGGGMEKKGLPFLKHLLQEYGYKKPLEVLTDAENRGRDGNDPRYRRRIYKLFSMLNRAEYEPLWRYLYGQISASQEGYPEKADVRCPSDKLSRMKTETERLMREHGYEGKYPDFVKTGSVRGVHLKESYEQLCFATGKAQYRIHCTVEWGLQFLCGTEFYPRKRKDSEPFGKDAFSCLFDAKGRRLFHTVLHNPLLPETAEEVTEEKALENFATDVGIAVKLAELRRLSSQEVNRKFGGQESHILAILLLFLFCGGLFGVMMTVGFMLIELILMLAVGQIQIFPELFWHTPWWAVLLWCWIGFGGSLAVITGIARRKRFR